MHVECHGMLVRMLSVMECMYACVHARGTVTCAWNGAYS